jgi:hypothetical protein
MGAIDMKGRHRVRGRRSWLYLITAAVLGLGCAEPPKPTPPPAIDPEILAGRVLDVDYLPEPKPFDIDERRYFYTAVNLWYERDTHATTNYRRGTLVPINSRVAILAIRREGQQKKRIFKVWIKLAETGDIIRINNVRTHSKATHAEIIHRTFSKIPVDLSRLDDDVRSKILNGQVDLGMTRYQVLLARGYPPGHRTPDLTGDVWEYWNSRFRSHKVLFGEGRVVMQPM